MTSDPNKSTYKDRSLILMLIGIPVMLIGIIAAVYGPIEFYPLYMFSEGGRFHYEGFGLGSLMFGNIAVQILGYYLVALIFIPLGYGHLRRRRWVRKFALSLLWFWLIVGAPLALLFILMLFSVKEIQPVMTWVIVAFTGFSYPVLPALLIAFYRREDVRLTLEYRDLRDNWWERTPLPISVLILLFGFYLVFLHIPLLFRGAFPFFGQIFVDLDGMFLIDAALLSMVVLLFGVYKRHRWAWWGSLIYFGLLLANTIMTLFQVSFLELIAITQFPPTEIDILQEMPVQSYHLIVFFGLPLFFSLFAIVVSKKQFKFPNSNL